MSILERQRAFYEALHREHGDSPLAVSYRDRETQDERFARIARVFPPPGAGFTVHEVGCGLGHFGDYLAAHQQAARYSGSDICPEFVEHCRRRFPDGTFLLRDARSAPPGERHDFVTESGTFNPRLDAPPPEWDEFIRSTLEAMYRMAGVAIAANFLSTYNDPEHTSPSLHYQDQRAIVDFVVARLSRHYEIDAAGPLYEYTLRVYRPEHVRSLYGTAPFSRYFRKQR